MSAGQLCAVVPFAQGSLGAADGVLPALSVCPVADRAVEHGLTCLPSPLFVVESLWLPHTSSKGPHLQQAVAPKDCSAA